MNTADITYFNNEKNIKNSIFFSRFPELNFDGLKILDLGCGHGAISIELAQKGAKKVLGLDLDKNRIRFANENLNNNYNKFLDIISFVSTDINDIHDHDFDMIISKASFEHIINLETLILSMKDKLKIGGKIVAGFGPLYNSPWGDHHAFSYRIPWMHVILPNKYLIKRINKTREGKISSIYDLGLNGLSLKKYKKIFNTNGLRLIYFKTNVSNKIWNKVFSVFTKIPFLEEYFTHNIYCILERID